MSYEPTLIIIKKDLAKHEPLFLKEEYDSDEDTRRVAKFLLLVNDFNTIKFDDIEFVLCYPELTSFNQLVRDKLDELEINYRIDTN